MIFCEAIYTNRPTTNLIWYLRLAISLKTMTALNNEPFTIGKVSKSVRSKIIKFVPSMQIFFQN